MSICGYGDIGCSVTSYRGYCLCRDDLYGTATEPPPQPDPPAPPEIPDELLR